MEGLGRCARLRLGESLAPYELGCGEPFGRGLAACAKNYADWNTAFFGASVVAILEYALPISVDLDERAGPCSAKTGRVPAGSKRWPNYDVDLGAAEMAVDRLWGRSRDVVDVIGSRYRPKRFCRPSVGLQACRQRLSRLVPGSCHLNDDYLRRAGDRHYDLELIRKHRRCGKDEQR